MAVSWPFAYYVGIGILFKASCSALHTNLDFHLLYLTQTMLPLSFDF